ncbi:hypothetical protein T05_3228 [Trichinella murrelli]|uniref:Uncharacterized protein n=1 Tax=Trichinella murrelli TaxID=144512 RepID=A0A0V0TSH0_9BILA|nr:hypothetical protein T05_3228 [Trichinella murrelli]
MQKLCYALISKPCNCMLEEVHGKIYIIIIISFCKILQDANENKYVSLIFCICESSISKIINRIVSLNQ